MTKGTTSSRTLVIFELTRYQPVLTVGIAPHQTGAPTPAPKLTHGRGGLSGFHKVGGLYHGVRGTCHGGELFPPDL